MKLNDTTGKHLNEVNRIELPEKDLQVIHSSNGMIDDQWDQRKETNPQQILINEKTVYAVDQAMNVVITDINGNVLYGNRNIFDLTLYKPEEIIGGHSRVFNAQFHSKDFFKNMWDTILSGNIWRGDLKNKRKDGKIIWVRLIITPLLNQLGKPYQFVALKEDITEKKEIEFQLAQKDKQLSALTCNSYDIVGIINQFGEITYLNPAFERVLGYPSLESIGTNLESFFENEDHLFWRNMLKQIFKDPIEPIRDQVKVRHRDESSRWCDVVFTNYLADPHINGIVFNFRDITKLKEATDRVNQIANYDFLTGLPNRWHFENFLRDSLKSAQKDNSRLALMFVDLDGFKHINDTLGHEIGDLLLKGVGKRITCFFKEKAFVSRFGGDEFAIVIPNVIDFIYLNQLAESLVKAFNRSFTVADYKLNVSASIGISIYPIDGVDMRTLLKNADVAMYRAKHNGKNHYQLYIPSMDQNTDYTLIE